MSYSSDPYWAYKDGYDPARRQAYEDQVMHDQVARDRHRYEADMAVLVGSSATLAFFSSKLRKQRRERKQWDQSHPVPVNYGARRAEYHRAIDALQLAGKATPEALDALKVVYADIIAYDEALEQRA